MFTFKVVDTYELLEESFKFRYKIAHEELNRTKANDDKIEIDEFDKYSIHYVAIDRKGKVCATTRFIINSPIGYPTANHMDIDFEKKDDLSLSFSELSRVFIAKEVRDIKNAKIILHNFAELSCYYIKKYDINYIYAGLEKNLLRLLNRFNINFKVVGDGKDFFGFRYPCISSSKDLVAFNPNLLKN